MELKEVMNVMQVSGERIPSGYYKKPEVDAVIAEKDAEIAELQETNVIIANNAVRLNKDIAELKTNERRLRRALWLMRAYFCGRSSEYFSGMASRCKIGQEDFYKEVSERAQRYLKASYKCQAKAEEYK